MEERKRKVEFETEERKRREEIEQQMWEAEQEQRRIELELRTRELQRQEARDKIEDQRKASAVVKGKLFVDAMRASAIRMGADPIETITFFRNVGQFFLSMRSHQRCERSWYAHSLMRRPRVFWEN